MKPPVKNIKNDIIKATNLIYIIYSSFGFRMSS